MKTYEKQSFVSFLFLSGEGWRALSGVVIVFSYSLNLTKAAG